MKVTLQVCKIENVDVEVPYAVIAPLMLDNCKENWDKNGVATEEDYERVKDYIRKNYGYVLSCDIDNGNYQCAEITSGDETITMLEG